MAPTLPGLSVYLKSDQFRKSLDLYLMHPVVAFVLTVGRVYTMVSVPSMHYATDFGWGMYLMSLRI